MSLYNWLSLIKTNCRKFTSTLSSRLSFHIFTKRWRDVLANGTRSRRSPPTYLSWATNVLLWKPCIHTYMLVNIYSHILLIVLNDKITSMHHDHTDGLHHIVFSIRIVDVLLRKEIKTIDKINVLLAIYYSGCGIQVK